MTPRTLVLEIVTPDGLAVLETGVDAVVVRRRERRFELGSELAILPLHAPMLVRMPVAPIRFRRGAETVHLALAGGFAQVRGDRVLVVTPRCERIPRGAPAPRAAAAEICRRWTREARDLRAEMIGLG